ncbi:MAG: aspartate carbamoyltransferase [Deltaproteobacteria bacterium]|nr:aspartate carbamoyltransferase [Deltaproteobacteria bacterium]
MKRKDLLSAQDLSLEDLQHYLDLAGRIEAIPPVDRRGLLPGKILATLFYEPSTRTRLSFDSAMHRLGGSVLGFSGHEATSVSKGETIRDTVRTVENYADIIVIRHPREGSARIAAEAARVPVINAGDGANQHPTQTLLDLYTILKFLGRLSDLRIALVGDLKYSRTVHSLFRALHLFGNVEFVLVSPPSLALPDYLKSPDHRFYETHELEGALGTCDIVYMTRIQRERFPDAVDYEKVKDAYRLEASMLEGARPGCRVLHPLPRVNEIAPDVDSTPHSGYFEQVAYGVTVRQAILLHHLGVWA